MASAWGPPRALLATIQHGSDGVPFLGTAENGPKRGVPPTARMPPRPLWTQGQVSPLARWHAPGRRSLGWRWRQSTG
jgi:hypothetical protein